MLREGNDEIVCVKECVDVTAVYILFGTHDLFRKYFYGTDTGRKSVKERVLEGRGGGGRVRERKRDRKDVRERG